MSTLEAVLDALGTPVRAVYGAQVPMHWGTVIRWQDGGPDPLDAMSAYWNDSGPHWHYICHGLSEIEEKVTNNPNWSGFGFELTFRLKAPPSLRELAARDGFQGPASAAPTWPLTLLNTLARYVFRTQRVFRPGHWTTLPNAFDPGGKIASACFVADPQLPVTETPHGKVFWLQLVGLVSPSELAAVQADDPQPALDKLRGSDGLYVTDPDRAPLF